MIINADPIASGAKLPISGLITDIPIVSTRKNVPINSVRYFVIVERISFAVRLGKPGFLARGNLIRRNLGKNLAPEAGLEPATRRLIPTGRDSTLKQMLPNPARRFHRLDLAFSLHRHSPRRVHFTP